MGKKRVSLTVEEEVLDGVDSEADRKGSNRSETVERILENYFDRKGLRAAAILCGDEELKSLELHNGRSVLSHVLDNLSEHGLDRVILLAGQNKERLKNEFGDEYKGLNLEYIDGDSEGTASALEKVKDRFNSTFAVLNGHVIAEVDLEEMLEVHRLEGATTTMALTTVEDPSEFGVARIKGQRILGFEEKPDDAPSRLINAGTYIVEPEIFSMLDSPHLEEVFESLSEERELAGYVYGGKWVKV